MEYVIVLLAKNEVEGIRKTLNSIIAQTWQPKLCLALDDNSTDGTSEIMLEYENKFNNIFYLENTIIKSEEYTLGGHVVELFNLGMKEIEKREITYNYIIKLDADIQFESDFIEKIFRKISSCTDIGIVSGIPFYIVNGRIKFENGPDWHTNGQFKIYNKLCLDDIGGLKKSLGWDTADNIVAISKGWKTQVFRDLKYEMMRKVGYKYNPTKGRINHGIGCYKLGYSIIYLALRNINDLIKKPYISGSLSVIYGYLFAYLNRYEKILLSNESCLLRKLLWQSLLYRLNRGDFSISL